MEQKHKDLIKGNFPKLMEEIDFDLLLPELQHRNIITDATISKYQTADKRIGVRRFFLHVQLLEPDCFSVLIDALRDSGQENVIRILAPSLAQPVQSCTPFRLPSMDELGRNLERQISIPIAVNTITEPLEIKVVPSDRFYDSSNELVYRTRSKNRGIALIINNIIFERDEERRGADLDGQNLQELFRQIGIKVKYVENLKAAEIKSVVMEHAKDKDLYCCDLGFFVFMSHGNADGYKQTRMKGTDGEYVEESWILSQFGNQHCRALVNKPKIFIFQMCRGDAMLAFRTETDGVAQNAWVPIATDDAVYDTIIAHSTLQGFQSHRDIYEGSWYINCLCKVFMEHAHNEDIENLLKKVDSKLRKMISLQATWQCCCFDNVGFKTCFLHPGIYEEQGILRRFS